MRARLLGWFWARAFPELPWLAAAGAAYWFGLRPLLHAVWARFGGHPGAAWAVAGTVALLLGSVSSYPHGPGPDRAGRRR